MKTFMVPFAAAAMLALASSASAGNQIANDMSKCAAGAGPAIQVNVRGIKGLTGKVRVQNYPATQSAWLASGKWLTRIEARASASALNFCLPLSASGKYAVAVRHDKNGNGKTDITSDGGGFSNNPSINILNLGKPSVTKVAFSAGPGVTTITINLKYM
jgi:uncharacterized protein (DUF2141 family)